MIKTFVKFIKLSSFIKFTLIWKMRYLYAFCLLLVTWLAFVEGADKESGRRLWDNRLAGSWRRKSSPATPVEQVAKDNQIGTAANSSISEGREARCKLLP